MGRVFSRGLPLGSVLGYLGFFKVVVLGVNDPENSVANQGVRVVLGYLGYSTFHVRDKYIYILLNYYRNCTGASTS